MEKFMNIKCRASGLTPDCAVIVATVRALKMHGGGPPVVAGTPLPHEYTTENVELVTKGCCNLERHITNAKMYGVPVVIAINAFATDTAAELEAVRTAALEAGAEAAVVTRHHALGGAGAVELAEAVVAACHKPHDFKFLYDAELPIKVWPCCMGKCQPQTPQCQFGVGCLVSHVSCLCVHRDTAMLCHVVDVLGGG